MAWHKPNSQTFFGLPHDVEIAAHLFDTISNCALAELDIYRSSAEFEREAKRARVEEGTGARAVLGTFITGIEERLYARLKALPDEKVQTVQEAAAATGRSLVVVKADQVKHDFEALGIRGALCRRLHAARLRAHPAFSQAKLMETANAKGVDLNFDGPSI